MSFVKTKKMTIFDYVNYSLLAIISIACVFPFIYVFSVSFTDPEVYVPLQFYLFPEKWSLSAYKYILSTNSFVNALKSTVFVTGIGTVLSILLSFTFAYVLTKKHVPGRKWMLGGVIFTLVFNAGILPNYLLMKDMNLLNSHWSLILSGLTNAWSLIVIKGFLDSLPPELEDAARIDGCSDIGVFWRIVIPLSMPAIAAFVLFFAVSYWNTYFNALVYLSDAKKWTLQVLVKSLVIDSDASGAGSVGSDDRVLPQETIRMASIVLAMVPILIIYPFLQKHFAKGVMLGSVKG
ncbi:MULTISPECIES: carbohydrate ABC transporter permease [Paenibacillus]|uniref:Carbohydrate ABC transporter permease n=2 Tax=Paenibacillus TaxID=44249 RepID=A0ABU6D5N4_9BACL|nr:MULTISPECIES: carbohydrate ABC transporter permease [Paenibacillus]MBA2938777.1 carbohydrate ABC transporter permease [Paenibacillus sp. CGMCC 1.16610]MCY9660092.1 carbohydrate ABC transporter permease [Paenibacillus anseongense]MEB4793049.1 carbohydrate ABC transporter permease [Paenibacillus chondroitinus]MVQ34740.1 ABC transporter permease subunit [Paenibacillus anseongense]